MTVINLPLNFSDVSGTLGSDGLIYKQLIPMGKQIVYGGKTMKFTRDILEKIKANYDAKIMDQTAFQLADDENRHDTPEDIAKNRNWDPERYRGDVEKLLVSDTDGLVMGVKPTEDGMALIKKNPKLGVSASIKPEHVDDQGKVHQYVLRHVVGTLNPKIKGMSPWKLDSITLSATDDDNEEVFDLTTTEPAPADTQTPNENSVSIPREEYDKMKRALDEFENGEKLLDDILAEEDDDEVEPTNLTDTEPTKDPAITALENRLAASEWRTERERYVNAGVPTGMLNLCDDLMSVAEAPVINLSDGESVDPRDTIRKLLDEAKGYVDLSDEEGHGYTPDERETSRKKADEFANGFINEWVNDLF